MSRGAALDRRCTWSSAIGVLLVCAGCASVAPPPTPAPAPAPPRAAPAAPAPARSAVAAFEQEQREAARDAQRSGRYVEAQRAWEVVLALDPADDEAIAGREHSAKAAATTAAERITRARQAQTRGDTEGAMRLYLEALSFDPTQVTASSALRALEHDRARRVTPLSFARAPAPRPAQAERSELEHASLLAAAGELDAAIALLTPLVRDGRGDPSARARLAELHLRRAELLAPTHRAAAVAEAERVLQIQPGHAGATLLLRRLRVAANGAPR
jgi:tetratricopeptide (TPR) repeat protein